MTKPPRELHDFLFRYDPGIQSLALGLRTLVLDEMAPCHEYIFPMKSKVVLLYGPTARAIADCVCSIGIYQRHAILSFHEGSELADPRGILEGEGKRLRHLKIATLAELDRPEIRGFLRKARRHAGLRRPRQSTARDVITRVKHTPARPNWRAAWPRSSNDVGESP